MEPTDALYLQGLLDSVKTTTRRASQNLNKIQKLWTGLKGKQVQSDLFVSQVMERIGPAVNSESKHRRQEFNYEAAISALEDYLALFQLYEVKQSLLAILDTEDYNTALLQMLVHGEFKNLFDQISVPVQEWASFFGQHQDLAENVWVCLTWTQRLCLKQGFLAKRLLLYLNEASTP
jgi:hypothetical protein